MARALQPYAAGESIGRWKVLGPPLIVEGRRRQLCACECGFRRFVKIVELRSGRSRQCRVCHCQTQRKVIDITGRTFGGWTVLRRIPLAERSSQTRAWLCRCKCGTELAFSRSYIERSHMGCLACAAKSNGIKNRLRPYESLFRMIRARAIKAGHSFVISYEEFVEIISCGCCHYCNVPLTWSDFGVGQRDSSSKLDRKDNDRGYVSGNIATCCWRCNQAKGNRFSYAEWLRMTAHFRIDALNVGTALSCGAPK